MCPKLLKFSCVLAPLISIDVAHLRIAFLGPLYPCKQAQNKECKTIYTINLPTCMWSFRRHRSMKDSDIVMESNGKCNKPL